jgi:hypothetical protein
MDSATVSGFIVNPEVNISGNKIKSVGVTICWRYLSIYALLTEGASQKRGICKADI